MTKDILRSAIAAVVGIVVAFGLIWLAQYAGSEFAPAEYDLDTGEILIPIGSTIALIVGRLAQARKQKRRLVTFGLSDHYREIFEITRLSDFMTLYASEQAALAGE